MLSVGGTTLNTSSATGAYLNESTWQSSGGGYSVYEPEPSYQYSLQSTGRRSVPDVAFDANPNTGVSVYTTDPTTGVGGWSVFGGTSLGAPAWAGIVAIVDEGYALAHIVASMDGLTQTLPILYSRPADTFHTVFSSFGPFTSPVTKVGLGTPDGAAFINSMLGGNILTLNGPVPGSVIFPPIGLAAVPSVQVAAAAAATPAAAAPVIEAVATEASTPVGPGQSTPTAGTGTLTEGRSGRVWAGLWVIPDATPTPTPAAPTPAPDATAPESGKATTAPATPAPNPPRARRPCSRRRPGTRATRPEPAAPGGPGRSLPGSPRRGRRAAPVVSVGFATLAPLQGAPALDLLDGALRSWDDEDTGLS